jgi:hypothetical protein
MVSDGKLTKLGKKFFYEVDKDNYRFLKATKSELEKSSSFQDLSRVTQAKLLRLFNNNNTYKIN